MYRTVRSQVAACGIISDVRRFRGLPWVAAWALGASLALGVAWLGVREVLRSTTGPVVPIVDTSEPPIAGSAAQPGPSLPAGSSGDAGSPGPAPGSGASPRSGGTAKAPGPADSPASPSPGASEDTRTYDLTGGEVTLAVTGTQCSLVAATPDTGFSVQNWSSMGWLRVDFNQDGNEVSSLVCDWYQQSPAITIGT
jgi:hypothetical protein